MIDIEIFDADPFPRTEVGLVDLGREWRVQDWGWSNNVENLHRIGGEPTWIQSEEVPPCGRCDDEMAFVGQIAVSDLTDGEGIAYMHWCDKCAMTAVVHQQT